MLISFFYFLAHLYVAEFFSNIYSYFCFLLFYCSVQPTDKQHLLDTGILGSLVYILQGLLSIDESYSKEAGPDDDGPASEENQTDSYTSRVRRLEVIPLVMIQLLGLLYGIQLSISYLK